MSDIWTLLGIAPIRDRDAIRRAYARRLKVTNPEDDAEAFAALRAAYEEALASLDWDWEWEDAPSAKPDFEPSPVIQAQTPGTEHLERLSALEQMLHAPVPPPPHTIEAGFDELMAAPGMEAVTTQADVELRILELILDNIPRSDPLVRSAINAFGWARAGVVSRRDRLVDSVLNRDADIGFRKGMTSPGVQLHAAYQALSNAPTRKRRLQAWLSPTLESDVRGLFREIDTRRHSLAADLHPDAYRWWRERLAKPGMAAWMIWPAIGLPLLASIVVGAASGSGWTGLATWAGAQAALLVCTALYVFAYARPRAWWQENWAWRARLIVRIGWAPASWLLLLAASVAPLAPWSLALICVVATALLGWCLITRVPDRQESRIPWLFRALIGEIAVIIWWVLLGLESSTFMPLHLQAAAAAAVVISMFGSATLLEFWFGEIGEGGRQGGFFVLLVAFLAGLTLLIQDVRAADADAPLMTAAFITSLALALRPAAYELQEIALRFRFNLVWISVIFGRFLLENGPGHWIYIGSVWMLLGAAVTLAVTGSQVLPGLLSRRSK